MARPQSHPLRPLTAEERTILAQTARSRSEQAPGERAPASSWRSRRTLPSARRPRWGAFAPGLAWRSWSVGSTGTAFSRGRGGPAADRRSSRDRPNRSG